MCLNTQFPINRAPIDAYFLFECVDFSLSDRYHQQQNKWYPPKCVYLRIFKLHSILAVANLLAHNNLI